MEGITSADVEDRPIDEKFRKQEVELALKLLRSSVAHSEKENLLISPLSIQLALAMTANGGVGQTEEEMESLLGGEIPLEQLNGYLHTYSDFLKSGKNSRLHIANSIWFRDDEGRLEVNRDFLETNSNYYGAQAYKAPFDEQTVKDINQWVKEQTDGMIDSIVEEISTDTMLYLINALSFDGKWEKLYNASDIWDGRFHSLSGKARPVEMMSSKEWCYLKGENVTGFIKDYKGGDYGFAALLPGEGMDIYEYVNSLQPQELMTILKETEEDSRSSISRSTERRLMVSAI
jgi:serpin B